MTFAAGDIFMGQTLARNLASTTGIDVFCECGSDTFPSLALT